MPATVTRKRPKRKNNGLTPELAAGISRQERRLTAREHVDKMPGASPGLLGEIGDSGLKVSRGIINEEIIRELEGQRKYKRFEEMELDPAISRGMDATTSQIRRLNWTIEQAGDDPREVDDAIYLRSVVLDMDQPWEQAMDAILTYIPNGWSWCETPLKIRRGPSNDPNFNSNFDDGLFGLRGIFLRPQKTLDHWELDDHKRAIGMWQKGESLNDAKLIPLQPGIGSGGSLHFRTTSANGNPEGDPWYRKVYLPWYYKSEFLRFLGQGVERDVAGMPVARVPAAVIEANGAEYRRWQTVITQLRRHRQNGLIIPGDRDEKGNRRFDVELLKAAGGEQFDLTVILGMIDRQILLGLGADWLLFGHTATGTQALSTVRAHDHALRVGTQAKIVQDVLNRVLVHRLFALNPSLGGTSKLPKFVHSDIEGVGMLAAAAAWEKLSKGGFPLGVADEDHFRRLADLPTREDNEALADEAIDVEDDDEEERTAA